MDRQTKIVLAQLDAPVSITIPYPSYIPRSRGVYSTGAFNCDWKIKTTREEKEEIEKAAQACGMTQSMFVRWCAMHVAREVIRNELVERD